MKHDRSVQDIGQGKKLSIINTYEPGYLSEKPSKT